MGVLPWTVGIFRHCKTTVGVSPGFCGVVLRKYKRILSQNGLFSLHEFWKYSCGGLPDAS